MSKNRDLAQLISLTQGNIQGVGDENSPLFTGLNWADNEGTVLTDTTGLTITGTPYSSFSSTGARIYPDGSIVVKTTNEHYVKFSSGVIVELSDIASIRINGKLAYTQNL